jgi:hypothetical protein
VRGVLVQNEGVLDRDSAATFVFLFVGIALFWALGDHYLFGASPQRSAVTGMVYGALLSVLVVGFDVARSRRSPR